MAEAFKVLRDPEKRSLHDRYGHDGLQGSGFQDFGDAGDVSPHGQFVLKFGWDELNAIQDAINKLIDRLTKLGNIHDETINDMTIIGSKTRKNLIRMGDGIVETFDVVDELNAVVKNILDTE